MPTIAESRHPEQDERRAQAVKEFIEAAPFAVGFSVDVLRARLFGLGLRGQDLETEVRAAEVQKMERDRKHTVRIHKPLWGGFPKHWAQGRPGSITWTTNALDADKYSMVEAADIRQMIQDLGKSIVVTIDGI